MESTHSNAPTAYCNSSRSGDVQLLCLHAATTVLASRSKSRAKDVASAFASTNTFRHQAKAVAEKLPAKKRVRVASEKARRKALCPGSTRWFLLRYLPVSKALVLLGPC